ncbi:peptidase M48 [Candidatus Marinamargulisbacteria bacterium SCGC AAA071-K20]|nr:peptidase M48 [Candidatus Marinamargulisbacteria bacterium SCGC AAA071-K20]
MNFYLLIILSFYILFFLIDTIVDILNVKHIQTELPEEFKAVYDSEKYQKSQEYLRECTRFSLIKSSFNLLVTVPFIVLGGFNLVDQLSRQFNFSSIVTGLLFFGLLSLGSFVIDIPFSLFSTFVIEKKYGFNKTTFSTFVIDILKSLLLSVVIGAPILALILWFFESNGANAWLYCWLALTAIQIVLMFVAPILIMPLFNKFEPLEEGELKTSILDYAKKENFSLKGLFTMDGSKRSTKSNAYFTGFGQFRRIVLFDTLIKNHSVNELLTIVAHEMGHYKKKHIFKMIVVSIISSGFMFFILSLFLNNALLFEAFKMDHISVYASLVFFSFLYSPIETILSVFSNISSRKHEFEADAYAVDTTNLHKDLVSGLKKLSVDNLSNLSPHPLKVFLEYSHPPVLERIKAINALNK